MIRIAIVEDEKQQYEILNSYLQRYGAENGETFDVRYFLDAVEFVSDYRYDFDLIFMDIMMPDLDGMKAAEKLRAIDGKVPLIFVTNMAQYAIQGYSVSARYFLLKPVNYDDFAIKMKDTLLYIKKEQSNAFLILDIPYEKRKIYEKDIIYLEVFAHDIVFHLYEGEIHVRGTLSEYEKKLSPQMFCRINSCYIVNLSCITAIKNMSVLIRDIELRISYSRKKALMKAFSNYVAEKG